MSQILPGRDGEPVPDDAIVFRVLRGSKDGKVPPNAFDLSSDDKKSTPPRLSVFAEELTTPRQAWEILGCRPDYDFVARLQTKMVRAIKLPPAAGEAPPLDVVWHPIVSNKPGAEGHAGIEGLNKPANSLQRRSCRAMLCALASRTGAVRQIFQSSV